MHWKKFLTFAPDLTIKHYWSMNRITKFIFLVIVMDGNNEYQYSEIYPTQREAEDAMKEIAKEKVAMLKDEYGYIEDENGDEIEPETTIKSEYDEQEGVYTVTCDDSECHDWLTMVLEKKIMTI